MPLARGFARSAALLAAVSSLTMLVLMLNVGRQIYDSNLVFASEATSLLAGDRLYHELIEWGAPLSAYLSAGAQLLVGHRLLAEFLLQWLFISAGVALAFRLGWQLSGSLAATCAVLPMVWLVVADTPTYHYSKLFVFPAALWMAWRHLERPTVATSAGVGLVTAVAFLFRHDYLFYVAPAGALALVGARLHAPDRGVRSAARDALVCAAAALAAVAPWLVAVQSTEGLVGYARLRLTQYENEGATSVYRSLLAINPLRQLTAERAPPTAGVVGFVWQDAVSEARQRELESRLGLRRLDQRDAAGRLQFAVPNVYDPRLLELDPYVNDGAGFEYERLVAIRSGLPDRDNAALWLRQMALLVPVVLFAAAFVGVCRAQVAGSSVPLDAWRMGIGAVVLMAADISLLREPSYAAAVLPLTAALTARFLVLPRRSTAGPMARTWQWGRWVTACTLLALTTYAAAAWARFAPVFNPQLSSSVAHAANTLLASPPADAYEEGGYRYLRECTRPGDRLLVGGRTPFDVSATTGRPIAGGHLYWHSRWGSDPVTEGRSLELLRRQSVPFALSVNGDRLLPDLDAYPRIRKYIVSNYREVEGSNGSMFVDARRPPTGTFGDQRLPCFR